MKIKLPGILPLIMGAACFAFPHETLADADDVTIRTEMISVPKPTAEFVLASRETITNPAGMLEKLHSAIDRGDASSIANQTIRGKIGGPREAAGGRVSIEWVIFRQKDQTITLDVVVKSGADAIVTSLPVTLGEVLFLGSFDPSKPASNGAGETNTYLTFIRIQ
jgi:hypothetical protein